WLADEAQARPYLALDHGIVDAALRRVVSHRWEDWRSEVVWMSLYFSAAVWLSIGLVHVRVHGRVHGRVARAVVQTPDAVVLQPRGLRERRVEHIASVEHHRI